MISKSTYVASLSNMQNDMDLDIKVQLEWERSRVTLEHFFNLSITFTDNIFFSLLFRCTVSDWKVLKLRIKTRHHHHRDHQFLDATAEMGKQDNGTIDMNAICNKTVIFFKKNPKLMGVKSNRKKLKFVKLRFVKWSLLYFSHSLTNLTNFYSRLFHLLLSYLAFLWVIDIKDQGQIIVSLLHSVWPKPEVGIYRSEFSNQVRRQVQQLVRF